MSNIKRGSLILFEGIDGSGKSTIARKISEKINARLLFEPVLENDLRNLIVNNKKFDLFFEDPDIKSINNYTEDSLKYYLFMASRVISLTKAFNLMNQGINVVLDRSFISTMVYQFDLGQAYIMNENIDLFTHLAETNSIMDKKNLMMPLNYPDLIIFLDINLETCLNRLKSKIDINDMDPKDLSEIENRISKYESAIKICENIGRVFIKKINANNEESAVVDSCLTTILPILQQ